MATAYAYLVPYSCKKLYCMLSAGVRDEFDEFDRRRQLGQSLQPAMQRSARICLSIKTRSNTLNFAVNQ